MKYTTCLKTLLFFFVSFCVLFIFGLCLLRCISACLAGLQHCVNAFVCSACQSCHRPPQFVGVPARFPRWLLSLRVSNNIEYPTTTTTLVSNLIFSSSSFFALQVNLSSPRPSQNPKYHGDVRSLGWIGRGGAGCRWSVFSALLQHKGRRLRPVQF